MAAAVTYDTVQDWLGTEHPHLADACDRMPGLADVFADIVEAIDMHSDHYQLDPGKYDPVAHITARGDVTVDLRPPTQ